MFFENQKYLMVAIANNSIDTNKGLHKNLVALKQLMKVFMI
jgi:hypothetical protein